MQNQEWKILARKGKRAGWGKLYNCCKAVWLGGQRNNQLKALMASDGVAVQGRWQRYAVWGVWVSDWGWSLDWGWGWGMWCASAANNGAMASVISCNCFPSFMTTTSSSSSVSVSASCSVSQLLSQSVSLSLSLLTFSCSWLLRSVAFAWPNEAWKFQALAAALTPFSPPSCFTQSWVAFSTFSSGQRLRFAIKSRTVVRWCDFRAQEISRAVSQTDTNYSIPQPPSHCPVRYFSDCSTRLVAFANCRTFLKVGVAPRPYISAPSPLLILHPTYLPLLPSATIQSPAQDETALDARYADLSVPLLVPSLLPSPDP